MTGAAALPIPGQFESTFLDVEPISPTVNRFRIARPHEFDFLPGQFLSLLIPTAGEKPLNRSYSIASPPSETGFLELCVNRVADGPGTEWLFGRTAGQSVTFKGPYGTFVVGPDLDPEKNLVLIATGTGIGPLRSMIFHLAERNHSGQIRLFFGVANQRERLYSEDWDRLMKEKPNFKVHFRPSWPRTGEFAGKEEYVESMMNALLPPELDFDYYVCGLGPLVRGVRELLKSRNVEKSKIHYERYS